MQKITLDLTINSKNQRLILDLRAGETLPHLAMKILAYILYHDRRPQVEGSAGQHFKPDLFCREGADVTLWVDVGDTTMHKLDKISIKNKRAEIVIIKSNEAALVAYKRTADRRIKYPERVRYLTFSEFLVDRMAARLDTRNRIEVDMDTTRRALHLMVNGFELNGRVVEVTGDTP